VAKFGDDQQSNFRDEAAKKDKKIETTAAKANG